MGPATPSARHRYMTWARSVTGAMVVCGMFAACSGGPPAETRSAEAFAGPFEGCPGAGVAHDVLNAFWSEVDRSYAVFDFRLKGQSWDDVGRGACAAISDTTSSAGLLDVIVGMARVLDDGHIQVTAPDLGRRETGWATGYEWGPLMDSLAGNIEKHYLDGPPERAGNGHFSWGRIGSIGYLNLGDFEELSESGDEDADTDVARAAMERAVGDLRGVEGIVVDIRNNEGGWDNVGLEVAHWFAGPRALTYSKTRRDGPAHDDFGPWEDVWVEASPEEGFDMPVVVLISGWTFSAAETFALSMRVRSNVTLLGERTSGHFSDLEPATLPNGWRYTYSSERYRAADGVIYEARGVPIDVPLDFDPRALAAGRDNMLEAALALLTARRAQAIPS
jgi:hypothetical protein